MDSAGQSLSLRRRLVGILVVKSGRSLCEKRAPAPSWGHFLKRMIARADQLSAEEVHLKSSMTKRCKQVLKHKNLAFFKELMEEAGSTDVHLANDMAEGFDLTGKLPASPKYFEQKFKPANLPTEALRGVADKVRSVLLANVKSCGDDSIDRGVLLATLKEKEKTSSKLPTGATHSRRLASYKKIKCGPAH